MKYGISSGRILLLCDAIVLFISLSYLDIKHMMYTLLASYILAKVMDAVQQGAYTARGIIIISDKYQEIGKMIDLKLERGFTYFKALGGYRHQDRLVIYVVVSPHEVPTVKQLVEREDPNAFVNVIDVHEALGEGFTYQKKRWKFSFKK